MAVGGEVLTPAVNCVHFNAVGAQWSPSEVNRLRRMCEGPLGGEFAMRTPFPDEVAACSG
jgi:hypothetical protein